jgi:hypothetical protein
MTPTELKKYLVEYGKTLDNKDQDEFYGTARDEWNNVYPQFLQWYNSHHNKMRAKELKKEKEKGKGKQC